jgi:hypothetical protein
MAFRTTKPNCLGLGLWNAEHPLQAMRFWDVRPADRLLGAFISGGWRTKLANEGWFAAVAIAGTTSYKSWAASGRVDG